MIDCVASCDKYCALKGASKQAVLELPDWQHFDTVLKHPAPPCLWKVGDQPLLFHWLDDCDQRGIQDVIICGNDRIQLVKKVLKKEPLRWLARRKICECSSADLSSAIISSRVNRNPWGWEAKAEPLGEWELLDWYMSLQRSWMNRCLRSYGSDLEVISIGKWNAIHPSAKLIPPYFLGDEVYIGPGAVVGPYTIMGNRSMVQKGSTVEHSLIGDVTYVGSGVKLSHSILRENQLVNVHQRGNVRNLDPLFGGSMRRRKKNGRRHINNAGDLWLGGCPEA